MIKITRKVWLPTVVTLALYALIAIIYFAPQFGGKELVQGDIVQFKGMSKDIFDSRERTGVDPQWTGNLFGGMPAYLIHVVYPSPIIRRAATALVYSIPDPAAYVFFAMVAMWLMLMMMGMNAWVAMVGGVMYGLSTYFFLIIGAGHITKMWALIYAPLMFGGGYMALRANVWLGGSLLALLTAIQVGANHIQITYYFLLALVAFWISEGFFAYKNKLIGDFAKRTGVMLLAGVVALGANFAPLWYTYEHTHDTMRGGSILAGEVEDKSNSGGLELDYATAWSYGRMESFNMLIPDFAGRDSATTLPTDGATAEALRPYQAERIVNQITTYWGDQPFTAGPTYIGAVVLFLAVFGFCLSNGRQKWWIFGISLFMLLLSWGSNLMWFTELMFRILPAYNKFRTVAMTLTVVEWTMPLLAAIGVAKLWNIYKNEDADKKSGNKSSINKADINKADVNKADVNEEGVNEGFVTKEYITNEYVDNSKIYKALIWSTGLTAGVALLFIAVGRALLDFGEANAVRMFVESSFPDQLATQVAAAMADDRYSMMVSDAWRTIGFVVAAAAVVWLSAMQKIKRGVMIAALTILVVVDMAGVGMRFLSYDTFKTPAQNTTLKPTAANRQIMEDKELGYRVMNLSLNTFNDATTSYFHRSVGGYHGAKLSRYQDLIESYLSKQQPEVLDMLNTKYLIVPTQEGTRQVVQRESSNGAAWFVENIIEASSPSNEMAILGEIPTKSIAVVERSEGVSPKSFAQGDIELVEYEPGRLVYNYTLEGGDGVAIFSEIYYNKGWSATIDGKPAPYFRANYLLRAMELPAGSHQVVWEFRAPRWTMTNAITLIFSLLILCSLIASLIYERRQKIKA